MRLKNLITVVILVGASDRVLAQSPITWQPPVTISSDADVSTNGSLAGAVNNGGAGVYTVPVNGIAFVQLAAAETTTISAGPFTLATDNESKLTGLDVEGPTGVGLSPEYTALLSTSTVATDSHPMTLTLANLSSGVAYELEVWADVSIGPGIYNDPGWGYRSSVLPRQTPQPCDAIRQTKPAGGGSLR